MLKNNGGIKTMENKNFGVYKRVIISIAKQLFYPSEVIQALREAKTENECTLIMTTARQNG